MVGKPGIVEICGYKVSLHAHLILQTSRKGIKYQWIERTIKNPDMIEEVSEREVRLWKRIPEMVDRFLRVVVNPQSKIIITVFFDRGIKK